jgi:hypothetical protein
MVDGIGCAVEVFVGVRDRFMGLDVRKQWCLGQAEKRKNEKEIH